VGEQPSLARRRTPSVAGLTSRRPRHLLGTPKHAGASFGVDGREEQATEEADVLEEEAALLGLAGGVALLPERVVDRGRRHDGRSEHGRGEARHTPGGEEQAAADERCPVDADEEVGVLGCDLGARHLVGHLAEEEGGLLGAQTGVPQRIHTCGDEDGREQRTGETAEYVVTGAWGKKAVKEAKRCGNVNVIFSSAEGGFRSVPDHGELAFGENAKYIHYTSNETIEGVEFKYDLDGGTIPVVCDASSNILSKPIDVAKYALIYAGAQKNIGPSGVTLVIIRDDLLDQVPRNQHSMLDYRQFAENGSMPNTPNTWGIYLISLVCEWLRDQGGTTEMKVRNEEKAAMLYQAIDSSDGYYTGHAERSARSTMNVTFRLTNEDLDKQFYTEATALGLNGLKGHRSVGGIRASIYNAFPRTGVHALVDFMQDFAQRKG